MHNCIAVTPTGWGTLSRVFGSNRSVLKEVCLYENNIDDNAIAAYANGLYGNETLEELDLSGCESVTPAGWRMLSHVLGSPHSALKKLDLSNNSIDVDVASAFANELRGNVNSQLTHLDISCLGLLVTNADWGSILTLLNNSSSIDATWFSNHTLTYLCPWDFYDELLDSDDDEDSYSRSSSNMPAKIYYLLQMNKHGNKKEVAREKVIENHFSKDFDVNVILNFGLNLLPRTISWFGRDSLGYSAVFTKSSEQCPNCAKRNRRQTSLMRHSNVRIKCIMPVIKESTVCRLIT